MSIFKKIANWGVRTISVLAILFLSTFPCVKLANATVIIADIQNVRSSFSFYSELPEIDLKTIENYLANSCKNEWDLDYRNWGVGVEAVASKGGTTVLGHYPEYVKLAESIGARRFQIPPSVWNKMSAAEQWTANTKFLDRMILRGDNIRLATPLNQVKQNSFLQESCNTYTVKDTNQVPMDYG